MPLSSCNCEPGNLQQKAQYENKQQRARHRRGYVDWNARARMTQKLNEEYSSWCCLSGLFEINF